MSNGDHYLGACVVRKSNIDPNMLGVFAKKKIPAGQLVTRYNGIWVETKDLHKFVDVENVFTINVPSEKKGGHYVPTFNGRSSVTLVGNPMTNPMSAGAFVNDLSVRVKQNKATKRYKITQSNRTNNLEFKYHKQLDKGNGNMTSAREVLIQVGLYTTQEVKRGEELGVDYGDDFWSVW